MPCAICGQAGGRAVYRDAVPGLANVFALVRCGGCGLVRMDPAPTEAALRTYYAAYGEHMTAPGRPVMSEVEARARADADIADLQRLRSPGRLLDIGCGGGHLLEAAAARGWEVFGVEASPAAVVALRDKFGDGRVWHGDAVPPQPSPFNVVVMRHVLEHLRDPAGALRRARNLLAHDGVLCCEVPGICALRIRVRGRPLMGQLHLWHFSAGTLPLLLQRAGFEVREVGFRDHRAPRSAWRKVARRLRFGLENAAWRWARLDVGTNLRVYAVPAARGMEPMA